MTTPLLALCEQRTFDKLRNEVRELARRKEALEEMLIVSTRRMIDEASDDYVFTLEDWWPAAHALTSLRELEYPRTVDKWWELARKVLFDQAEHPQQVPFYDSGLSGIRVIMTRAAHPVEYYTSFCGKVTGNTLSLLQDERLVAGAIFLRAFDDNNMIKGMLYRMKDGAAANWRQCRQEMGDGWWHPEDLWFS